MKLYKYLFLMLSVAFLGSCDDYLDVEQPSSFDADYVFSNVSDAEKMINGIYACFPVDPYTSRMSCVFMQNTDVEATAVSDKPDGSRRDVWSLQGGLLQSWSDVKNCWNNCYLAIDRANQCIEGIEASALYKAGDATMAQYLGEAYCLRAYWYWMMCNYWGDVPMALQASKAGMELNNPRTDKNIIYSQMIQDLVNIEEKMMWADESKTGIEKVNREFAIGSIARLAMFRAGYGTVQSGEQKRADDYLSELPAVTYTINGTSKTAKTSKEYYQLAKDYAQKLISLKDRPLNPSFKEVFMNECKFIAPKNDDVLFEVAYAQNNGGDVAWCVGLTVDGGAYGSGGSYITFPVSYYYSFDDADLRLPVTCSLVKYKTESTQEILGPNGTVPAKWCRLWLPASPGPTSSKGTGINWPIMRYSDVLLILAEAENEINGPSSTAKDALNRVRSRAFSSAYRAEKVNEYINKLSSQELFRQAIINERAWEFGGECIRKFDLIRWGNYGEKVVAAKNALNNMGKAANELELEKPEVAQYKNLADIFYSYTVNGMVTVINPRYKISVNDIQLPAGVTTYTATNWNKNLYKKVTATDGTVTWETADFTARSWRGYKGNGTLAQPVPYLLPIPYDIVSKSNGVLSNNGYGLVLTNN